MKSKQSTLLSQLDTLDEECGNLREELVQVENNRQKLACDLQQVEAQYKLVQKQLGNEQVCMYSLGYQTLRVLDLNLLRVRCPKQIKSKTG